MTKVELNIPGGRNIVGNPRGMKAYGVSCDLYHRVGNGRVSKEEAGGQARARPRGASKASLGRWNPLKESTEGSKAIIVARCVGQSEAARRVHCGPGTSESEESRWAVRK